MPRRVRPQAADGGFTLIELLVVMIIIGVLAAIAVPAYASQKQKAHDTAIKSDIRHIIEAVKGADYENSVMFTEDTPGLVTITVDGELDATVPLSPGNELAEAQIDLVDGMYCVSVQHGDRMWRMTSIQTVDPVNWQTEKVTLGDCNTIPW